jgi:CubicO group peptidase (beta-lactamase class C family)
VTQPLPDVEPQSVGLSVNTVDAVVERLQSLVEEGTVPGLTLAASRDKHIFLRLALGTTADGAECPHDLVFPSMSFGKGITATAIARVQAEGGFEWDHLVSRYVPEFAQNGKQDTTMRHLLSHAAGIPWAGVDVPIPKPDDWTDVIAALCAAEAEWPPGSRTEYHGLSAIMVGAEVARRVSGETWEELYHAVVDPIGCKATLTVPPPGPGVRRFSSPEELEAFKYHPAGAYFVQVDDILRFLHLHLDGGRYGDDVVLPNAGWLEMHRPQYAHEIELARARGEPPLHEWWAIGWLLRGSVVDDWPTAQVTRWFGLAAAPTPQAFSHAGTSTVLGIAEPSTHVAVALASTAELADEDAVRLRATAADLLGAISDADPQSRYSGHLWPTSSDCQS